MDEIIPDKRRLIGLVEQAAEGKLCLPNFQRSFVWSREQVADLLRSVLKRYFIGSLLLLRCDPRDPPFAPIAVRGATPPTVKPRPEMLILDGQQRLTSLLYALTSPDLPLKDSSRRRHFFIDLKLLLEDPESAEVVFDRSPKDLGDLGHSAAQYAQRVLPCTVLLKPEAFMKWRDGFDDWLRANEPDNLEVYRRSWRDVWTKAVNGFQNFEVPLVELPRVAESDSDAIGRICAIFEKLNSTGVELSVYDLLTARLYRSSINLHQLWKDACHRHKRLNDWSEGKADKDKFGVLTLRTVALLRNLDPKPRVLIDLKPEGFAKDWERATAAIDRALQLLEHVGVDGFGVFDKKWLPGHGLIPVLAALRAEIESRGLGEQARGDLRRWYWCSVFLERYSSAVESKSRKDYAEMLEYWTKGTPEPTVFSEAHARVGAPGFTIRESASHASMVYCGIFSLLALRSARDWRRGENLQLQKLEDHHIFPRAFLRRHEIPQKARVNSVTNRTLISRETNRKIMDAAPADYLRNPEVFPSGATEALLEPHFLGRESLACLVEAAEAQSAAQAASTYERFRKERERAILMEVRRVCGVDSPDTSRLQSPAVVGTSDGFV